MSTAQSGPMILAIGVRDDLLHVYDNDRSLLASHQGCPEAGEKYGALEFFDSDGYRLAGEYDRQWMLARLTRAADAPNATLVRQRMQNCLDHLQWYIKSNPEKFEACGMTAEEALALCPDLDGSSDLTTSMRTLADHFDRSGQMGIKGDYWDSWCRNTGWC